MLRLLVALLFLAPAAPSWAQGFFMPPAAQQSAPAPARPAPPRVARPVPRTSPAVVQPLAPPPMPGPVAGPAPEGDEQAAQQQTQIQLPPVPDLPALAKTNPPPAAVIGVLGIPEIMRASTAAQQVEKAVSERRERLNEDAQKEQALWREMQQSLANQRASLSADQIHNRERELQERITNAQRVFRDRNRIIQEAGQYGLAQIERMLIGVIRQVAESRGMNLVLHRAQVALNVNEFDITEQVADQLNRVLPSVALPPEGVPLAQVTPPANSPPNATPEPTPASAIPGATPGATTAVAPSQAPPAADAATQH